MTRVLTMSLAALLVLCAGATAFADPSVRTLRVPNGGLQPEALVDRDDTVHLIYLTGDASAADIHYHRFPAAPVAAGGIAFGPPLRVNTHPASALAVGTVRGPHLALGRDKSVHVAWMGSRAAEPKAPVKHAPMLYARLRAGQPRFDRERNVVTNFVGLDGGGSIAADSRGNVYVAWHAPVLPKADESTRRVYVARSTDNGDTFAREQPLSDDGVGVCACCGIKIVATGGGVAGMFRTARDKVHRDARAFLFRRGDEGTIERAWESTLDPAESAVCMMSTFAFTEARSRRRFVAAWETAGRIRAAGFSTWGAEAGDARDVPGADKDCKHPAVAVDRSGNVLVAWAVGTGWNTGGAVAWQLFDRELSPLDGDAAHGRAEDLPAWSKPAVVALPDGGGFVVIY